MNFGDWSLVISLAVGVVLGIAVGLGPALTCTIIKAPFYYPPYFFCKAVSYCFKKMKTCLGVDEEIVHDIENGTLPTANPPQPQQQAAEQQNQQKAKRVESYEVFRHRKDAEAVVGFHSGECAICLGEYEEDDECVMLKKCKHTYHRECIDKVEQDSCPVCRHSIDVKIEKS